MRTADFDSDGEPDIAVLGNAGSDVRQVVVQFLAPADLGIGRCGRRSQATIPAAGALDLTASDLNGNERPDLVIAESNGTQVVENTAQGFNSQFPIPPATNAVVTGNFNRDLLTDIAAANDSEIELFFADSQNFDFVEPPTSIPVGHPISVLVAADMNRDGVLDLVSLGSDGVVSVLVRSASDPPVFTQIDVLATLPGGEKPNDIAEADFDGQSARDLVVSFPSSGVAVLRGSGTGTALSFQQLATVATGAAPSAVATGLLNEDTFTDVVVTNRDDGTITILTGDRNGALAKRDDLCPGSCSVGRNPQAVVIDLLNDGDDLADIIVGSAGGGGEGPSLTFFLSANPHTPTPTNSPTVSPTATDTGTHTSTPTPTPTASPTGTPTQSRTVTTTATFAQTLGPFALMGEGCSVTTDGRNGGGVAWAFLALLLVARLTRRA